MPQRRRLMFLVGPTASGKSSLALELAGRLNAEILSLDSMAVYRGMDIGTAKPSAEELAAAPHHLIDICDPSESFNTGRYVEAAEAVIDDVTARGRTPLFVGGTALYLKAITEGLFEGPPADWELRGKLQAEADEHGVPHLFARLEGIDPTYAAKIHHNDLRRIIRALEVHRKTGRPISEQHTQFGRPSDRYDSRIVCIRRERAELVRRIDRRVVEMFKRGFVEEVAGLLEGRGMSREARQALGYRQIIEHLGGRISRQEALELTQRDTRRFAKRQMTWFRSIAGLKWLDIAAGDDASPADRAEALLLT